MITGAINHDGTIGPVGNVLEKAKAAKEFGAELLLVPMLQSTESTYETYKYCEKVGVAEVCTTEHRPKTVNVSEETGIAVVEVQTVQEALKYLLTD
jgi:predicted S18 family serine protease